MQAENVLCVLPGLMWYAAPDYLRLTLKDADNRSALYSVYEQMALTVADWVGEDIRVTESWGFNGYNGRKCGPAAWGAGYNGLIIQVEGAGAERLRALNPPHDNVARLDVQVTIWYDRDIEDLARAYSDVLDWHRYRRGHRPYEIHLHRGFGKGDTLYLGSRKSAHHHRIYDKMRAPNGGDGYDNAWRFEAELKQGAGNGPYASASKEMPPPAWWASIVVSEFESRGVELSRAVQSEAAPSEKVPRGKTSHEKRLRWLARQVAPSIAKLRASGVPERLIALALTGSEDAAIMFSRSLSENGERSQGNGGTVSGEQEAAGT